MAVNLSTLSFDGTAGTPTGIGSQYVSIATWEAAAQSHGVGDQTILECYKGDGTVTGKWGADGFITDVCTLSGWSNLTPTDRITIRAAVGEGHGGVSGAGFGIHNSSNVVFSVRVDYVTLEDIEAVTTGSSNTNYCVAQASVGSGHIFNRCIFRTISTSGTAGPRGINLTIGTGHTVTNCLAYSPSATLYGGKGFTVSTENSVIENCTSVNYRDECFSVGMDTGSNINNVAYGATTSYRADGVVQPVTCASDDGLFGTTVIDSTAFVAYASDNFNPAPGGLLDGSVTTTTDLTGSFTDDITTFTTGLVRVAPIELGAYEIAGAPAGALLTSGTVTGETQTTATIGCSTDTAGGTLYWYVKQDPNGAIAPTPADLKDGTGSAAGGTAFGNLVPGGTGPQTAGVTGLTANTQYWHYWIQVTA